jgi:hypothetical protein
MPFSLRQMVIKGLMGNPEHNVAKIAKRALKSKKIP